MTTIAAIATAHGNAGVGIIRLSGPKSLSLVSKIFNKDLIPRTATFGEISIPDVKDFCIVLYFPTPNSFTGEDVIEIQAHGGSFLLQKILDHLVSLGATPATAGEFSKRAFLNGKMSLSAAESLIDLINSESDAQLRSASSLLGGPLLKKLQSIESQLTTLVAKTEAALDHPELDLDGPTKAELSSILDELDTLTNTESQGRLIANGIQIAVLGRPNVGKSSLFNALLGRDRAIVTNTAGTTTDTISETIHYNGYRLIFNDTAGIHSSKNKIERLGIARSIRLINDADMCLVILDATSPLTDEDNHILNLVDGKLTLFALNKVDLHPPKFELNNSIQTSAKTGKNIELIKQKIFDTVLAKGPDTTPDFIITNTRHLANLKSARDCLSNALLNLDSIALDLTAVDIISALNHIGQISGTQTSESVINEIFSRFCLGK